MSDREGWVRKVLQKVLRNRVKPVGADHVGGVAVATHQLVAYEIPCGRILASGQWIIDSIEASIWANVCEKSPCFWSAVGTVKNNCPPVIWRKPS